MHSYLGPYIPTYATTQNRHPLLFLEENMSTKRKNMSVQSQDKNLGNFRTFKFTPFKGKSHVFHADNIKENPKSINLLLCDKNRGTGFIEDGRRLDSLFHFMKCTDLVEEILSNELTLKSPLCWDDPYDYLFYENFEIQERSNIEFACLCFSYNKLKDEDALWRIYDENFVRVEFELKALIDKLEEIAKDERNRIKKFYFAAMCYNYLDKNGKYQDYGKRSMKKRHKECENRYESVEQFISHMCCKRKAFQYEKEIRLFAVGDNLYKEKEKRIVRVGGFEYNKKIIKSVNLPPLHPVKYDSPRYKYYEQMQNSFNKGLRDVLKKAFGKRSGTKHPQISQSQLYRI